MGIYRQKSSKFPKFDFGLRVRRALRGPNAGSMLYKKRIESSLSSDEVDYTRSSILLVKNMLCTNLHRQKGFNSILFSRQIRRSPRMSR